MRKTWLSFLPALLFVSPLAGGAEEAASQEAGGTIRWSSLLGVVLVVAALGAIAILTALARRYLIRRKMAAQNDPRKLLHELCKVHNLPWRAEALLRKAAVALGTPHPARFFLEPQLLSQASTCPALAGSQVTLQLLHAELFEEVDE